MSLVAPLVSPLTYLAIQKNCQAFFIYNSPQFVFVILPDVIIY